MARGYSQQTTTNDHKGLKRQGVHSRNGLVAERGCNAEQTATRRNKAMPMSRQYAMASAGQASWIRALSAPWRASPCKT